MNVCVVALGKIGLPLAVQIAGKGHRVIGADIDQATVDAVNAGRPPFPGEAHLEERLADVIVAGTLEATTDTATAVAAAEAVIVVVPLLVDDQMQPDFGAMDAATVAIAPALQPGTLVSYETTLPIHTTRQRLAPMLERGSSLTLGEDLFVCHSPERVYSGRIFADLRRYPKLVGGLDPTSARRAVAFYEAVLDFDVRDDLPRPNGVWDLGSAEAAEFAKLAETTYRDVNIALANEFALHASELDVDIQRVIDAANSQPFSHIHRPGIAVGGHCIPVYPRFYLSTDTRAQIPSAARRVNEGMPGHTVDLLKAQLGSLEAQRVAVLGAAYRGGVKETAFSGVFPTVEALRAQGAIPVVHDPLYDDEELRAMGLDPYHLGEPCDAAVLQADHPEYTTMRLDDLPGLRALVDGRNVLSHDVWGDRLLILGSSAADRPDDIPA